MEPVKEGGKELIGEILIVVSECKDLSASSYIIKAEHQQTTKKSKEQKGNSKWAVYFGFRVYDWSDKIVLKVEDAKKKSLGSYVLQLSEKARDKNWEEDLWIDLQESKSSGKVHLCWKFHVGKITLYTVPLSDYEIYITANDPQKLASPSGFKGPHELVSLKKKRFDDGKYDLDLAYITEQIIAMGFPSDGMEKMYRNSMKTTQDFLNDYHPLSYKVYNLCSERSYPANKFFRCGIYPFADHNVPSFELIYDFCLDCAKWLEEGENHLAAVHCKAGKGRTGLMICCFLMFQYGISFQDAMDYYGRRRTHNAKGVTIPSQVRWIIAFSTIKDQMRLNTWKPHRPLKILKIEITAPPNGFQPDIYIECPSHKIDFEMKDKSKKAKNNEPLVFDLSSSNLYVNKETKITCFDLSQKDKKPFFWLWFHTKLCPENCVWSFKKYEIDKLKKASDDFVLTVTFEESPDHQFKTGTERGLALAGKRDSQVFDKNVVQQAVNANAQAEKEPAEKDQAKKGESTTTPSSTLEVIESPKDVRATREDSSTTSENDAKDDAKDDAKKTKEDSDSTTDTDSTSNKDKKSKSDEKKAEEAKKEENAAHNKKVESSPKKERKKDKHRDKETRDEKKEETEKRDVEEKPKEGEPERKDDSEAKDGEEKKDDKAATDDDKKTPKRDKGKDKKSKSHHK